MRRVPESDVLARCRYGLPLHGERHSAAQKARAVTPSVTRFRSELRDDGDEYGVIAQFYQNEEFVTGRRFHRRMDPTRTPRETAIDFADERVPPAHTFRYQFR